MCHFCGEDDLFFSNEFGVVDFVLGKRNRTIVCETWLALWAFWAKGSHVGVFADNETG